MKKSNTNPKNIYCQYTNLVDPVTLVQHPKNPNKHPDSQIRALAKILATTGWRNPIVVSKRSGFVIAGHGRLQAAMQAGMQMVPVSEQDFENEAQEYAHMIADNKIAELSEIDNQAIVQLIHELGQDFDLSLTGLEQSEIDKIFEEIDFEPGDENDQGKLDELDPKMVKCPKCLTKFDARGNES